MDETQEKEAGSSSRIEVSEAGQFEFASRAASSALPIPPSALGSYGDIPVAYAIFRVDRDEDTGRIVDARYIYVNEGYCRACGRTSKTLIDCSYSDIYGADDEWLERCHRVVVDGETVSGFEYDLVVGKWVSYNLAPSAVDGCLICAFVALSDEQRDWQAKAMSIEARTSHFVSEMLSALTGEQNFEAAMNDMLEMLSVVVRCSRMSVFECSGLQTKITFERCTDGEKSMLGTTFDLPRYALKKWFRPLQEDPVVLVPDVSILERFSKPLYDWCRENDIDSLMAAPFYSDDELVGFLGAYNYCIDEMVDFNRLFAAVSLFIGARIDNRQLIESLAQASTHDALTDLLNRRGAERVIEGLFADHPDEPRVLVYLDLDDFKKINDVHGHTAGDEALRKMASAMRSTFPESSLLCRSGGDEFLALLSGEDARNVESFVERFSHLNLKYESRGALYPMTTSIGYASYPDQAKDMMDLYMKADVALYAVKLAGKAGFRKYTPEAESHFLSRLAFTPHEAVDNVPYSMIAHKAGGEGVLLFASVRCIQDLGCGNMYDLMQLSGGVYEGIVHEGDREHVLDSLSRRLSGDCVNEEVVYEFRALTKSGSTRIMQAATRITDVAGIGEVFYTVFTPRGD